MATKKLTIIDKTSAYIVDNMKPMLYIEYFYGIFRSRLSGRSSDTINLRMKMLGASITITWVTIFYFAVGYSIENFKQLIQIMNNVCFMLLGFTYASSAIGFVLFHTQKYQKAIEILAGVDIALFANIDRKVYEMSFRQCKKLITLYIMLFIASLAVSANLTKGFRRIVFLLFTFIYCQQKIEILVFCQFLYMLKQRLLIIKNYLSKIKFDTNRDMFMKNTRSQFDFNFIGHISNTNYKIRDLACAYSKIGKVFMLINEIYNYFILSTLAIAFTIIILAVWSNLIDQKLSNQYFWPFSTMFYVFVELFSIILLSYYCQNIIAARNGLNNLLFRITRRENLPLSMRYQANVFVELTQIWHLSINVFHMFDVNLQLILKFISICTSALILVIQINRLI
nr:gustatory receptor 25.1 [Papilio memnon]